MPDEGDGCMGHYRNHYASDQTEDIKALCAAGLIRDHGEQPIASGLRYYTVTPAGLQAMHKQSPKPPKESKSKSRYAKWLKVADAYGNMTFGQWLKMELYRDENARKFWGKA